MTVICGKCEKEIWVPQKGTTAYLKGRRWIVIEVCGQSIWKCYECQKGKGDK